VVSLLNGVRVIAAGVGVAPLSALVDAKRELTPLDAIATVRIMDNHLTLSRKVESRLASPDGRRPTADGRRHLIRLVYGDAKRNSDWLDLMTGSLDSL
jgi:hypothetical protein